MGRNGKIGLLGLLAIGLVVLFYFISPSPDKEEDESKLPTKELYAQKLNKDGVYILHKLLETYPNTASLEIIRDPLDSTLVVNEDTLPSIYFLIDRDINVSPKAIKTLLNFVDSGNHAFVAIENFDNKLAYEFTPTNLVDSYDEEVISLSLTHDSLKTYLPYALQKHKNNKPVYRTWNYFELSNFRRMLDDIEILGIETYYDSPVFVRIPYGKGFFYLHSVPASFTNESMFSEDGFEYAQRVLSNLPKGHYKWHSHLDVWDYTKEVNPTDNGIPKESPIQYILKDRSLRWAYLLLVFSLIVYVMFKIKRRQNIIRTVEPNTNNSLEFVDTVSRLYLKQEKHYKFIRHYEQSFIHFIKDKYYISSPKIDEGYLKSVALKSNIDIDKIQDIFLGFKNAKKSYAFSSDQLIELHKKIEYFYKNCK